MNLAKDLKLRGVFFCLFFLGREEERDRIMYYKFPTLKFFPKGKKEPEDYEGDRSAQGVVAFVNSKAGTNIAVAEPPLAPFFFNKRKKSRVTKLTADNFESIALDSTKNVLVEQLIKIIHELVTQMLHPIFLGLCGHCKSLAPIYEELALAFAGETSVVIAKVDATTEEEVASKYDIQGYPTLKWFAKDAKDPIDYDGGRSLDDFVEWVNDKAGTRRNVDGSLKKTVELCDPSFFFFFFAFKKNLFIAGRFFELDTLAHEFYVGDKSADATRKEFQTLCSEDEFKGDALFFFVDSVFSLLLSSISICLFAQRNGCDNYLKLLDKIAEKGAKYATDERDRLDRVLSSGAVRPDKRTGMLLRRNVLTGFIEGSEFMGEPTGFEAEDSEASVDEDKIEL
ncbi:protein disulfide isomerase [Reticulomyxa filosa]|uniref:protein disulfide-isomerase n=1 Tax=Reticulomyxa filosa TaxID=46433 RepID=X6MDN3_RETFI|nr:protein disulfide isomerase [Reticulomyxa filosa]|eukprot:ETO11984.1 protein disulfide isomerase [Reticulomyxa filosa]